ncbi:hypothetical protein ACSQ67_019342 [Phaseolus vulgaris]
MTAERAKVRIDGGVRNAARKEEKHSHWCSQTHFGERLHFILETRPEWWVYAIFGQATKESDSRLTLEYGGDDFFIGSKGKEGTKFGMSKEQTRNHVNDIEWFYMVSQTRSYAAGTVWLGVPSGRGWMFG